MSNLFVENQTHYEFITTADGSPSICLWSDDIPPEPMHNRRGALSESVFLYLDAFKEARRNNCGLAVLSVGLGCAYNEMLVVAHCLAEQIPVTELYLESFEGDENIREGFIEWAKHWPAKIDVRKKLHLVFEEVSEQISTLLKISQADLKSQILKMLHNNQLVLRQWLTPQTLFEHKFGVIFFDAFSNQTTPEIWTDTFLMDFNSRAAQPACVFATYAATGALKRSLLQSGFTLKEQSGFAGKRQSTRAIRL